jgi:peptide deformylase
VKQLNVLQFGAAELREKAAQVTVFNKKIHEIIDDMAYTLRCRGDGAALAANQVGVLKRIVVIDTQDEYYELINPEFLEKGGLQYGIEGCLSYLGFEGNVPRYGRVVVRFQDRDGKFHELEKEGFMARCLQHEMDHLDGVLYIDRMTEEKICNPDTGMELGIEEIRLVSRARLPQGNAVFH